MKKFCLISSLLLSGCAFNQHNVEYPACNAETYQRIESAVFSGDGQGHGPDLGSDEWKSVIEFKLGIREDSAKPAHSHNDWCGYVLEQLPKSKR